MTVSQLEVIATLVCSWLGITKKRQVTSVRIFSDNQAVLKALEKLVRECEEYFMN